MNYNNRKLPNDPKAVATIEMLSRKAYRLLMEAGSYLYDIYEISCEHDGELNDFAEWIHNLRYDTEDIQKCLSKGIFKINGTKIGD